MTAALNSPRGAAGNSRRAARTILIAVLGLWLSPMVNAQYAYDPNSLDEQGPGIKYFGSVKDEKGGLLKGAIVMIQYQYIAVTDEQGRFRMNLPDDLPGDKVAVSCVNPGYETTRVNKRPGPHGPKQTVQIDCIMRVAT
jgi:hypothetical protein